MSYRLKKDVRVFRIVLVKLFESKSMGENGLRYLVAWSIYRQLLTYTVPERLFGKGPVSYQHVKKYCYELVGKVMNRAMKSPYFQSQVPLEMVDQAKRMVTRLRSAFRKSLESSSWFTGRGREVALRKLDNLTTYVGSPDNRLDPVSLEKHYKPYPDALPDRLFPTLIKALSLSTHDIWLDKTTWLYDETEVTAFYNYNYNTLVVPTSLLQRPFFYPYGLLGLNYGGLGAMAAHELMHAFDVKGITLREAYQPWNASDIIKEYTKRALCLRQMHRSVLPYSARKDVLNAKMDSENLADWVGTITAYAAFAALSSSESNVTLAGLDMSAERLFYVNHCVTWCHQYSTLTGNYAPYRSRCIVPLMNMPEFSRTFGCAPGEPMNPRNKCTFWH
ncbi:neprilysin-3 [Dermacentor silvarum]|uniref:neprilysin-3 n=1 Tax=Dermacentor silvarum TaxID=543639 RepID=UPI0021015FA4|nr:neprilysin-3 [Dermacentor silvarum]